MPRTIVYDEPVVQVEIAKELKPGRPDTPTGPKAATRRTAREEAKKAGPNQQAAAAENPVKDDIPAKLAKYVPGEVVAALRLSGSRFQSSAQQRVGESRALVGITGHTREPDSAQPTTLGTLRDGSGVFAMQEVEVESFSPREDELLPRLLPPGGCVRCERPPNPHGC